MMANTSEHATLDRERLARLCEMFRSDNEQERATAARMATTMLAASGLTWSAVIQAGTHASSRAAGGEDKANQSRSGRTYRSSWDRHDREILKVWDSVSLQAVIEALFKERRRLSKWEQNEVKLFAARIDVGLSGKEWERLEELGRTAKVWTRLGGSRGKPKRNSEKTTKGRRPPPRSWARF